MIILIGRQKAKKANYNGGYIMSKYQKLLNVALATALATGALVSAAPTLTQAEEVQAQAPTFSDVKNIPSHHFYEAVTSLASRGIIKGYEDGTFKPNQVISREHAAKIMALALDLDVKNVTDPEFKDVNEENPYYIYIAALVKEGVIKGFEDKTFKPKETLTRAQMSQMIVLGFGFDEVKLAADLPFTDVNNKQWSANYIQTLYSNEITTGATATTFEPKKLVTRGQMASFIFRSENKIGGIVAEDFGNLTETSYTAGAALTEGKTLSDVQSLTVEWYDHAGKVVGKGKLTDKLAKEYPTATQLSMPFDAKFNYITDGYWTVEGNFTGEPTKVKFTVTYKTGETTSVENTRIATGDIEAQDFGFVSGTMYSAGAGLTDNKTLSDVESLTAEWYDLAGNVLGKGTLTDKLAKEFPTATQLSMPFDPAFDYATDGYWTTEGKFTGEPAKVKFTVKYKNGKEASIENTRTVSGGIVAQDFGFVSGTMYSAGAGLTENKTLSDVATLTAEWFDEAGTVLGKGTLTDKLAKEFPTATQLSMPFDPAFDYVADGIWAVEGKFTGVPTKVKFTVTYKNGKQASVENTKK